MIRRLLALLAVTLLLVGCGAPQAEPTTVELVINDPATAETEEVEVPVGSEVTLRVVSDVDSDIHVHGYERIFDVTAGETVEDVFVANMAGAYEIESHDHDAIYMKLRVS